MPIIPRRPLLAAAAFLVALPTAAQAQIGGSLGFNVFVFDGFTSADSETNGRLLVGGSATLSSYGVGTDRTVPTDRFALYVGGTLTASNVGIGSGRAYAGSGGAGVSFNAPAVGPIVTGSAPLAASVAAEQARLTALSASLGAVAQTAGASVSEAFGTWTFTGTGAGVNVFTVDASAFNAACTINVNIPTTATAIVNVRGAVAQTTDCGVFINGGGANGAATTAMAGRVLWNYFEATNLQFRGSMIGSVLAPNALFTMPSAQLVGDFVGRAGTGNTEFYVRPFVGELPPTSTVPEPGTWALVGVGLAGVGAVVRRRAASTGR